MDNYKTTIRDAVLDDVGFVRATFSGRQRGKTAVWQRLVVRPVTVKGTRHLQFSFFDEKQNIVKNYAGETAVTHNQQQLSYTQLNQRANQLAHILRQHGVGPETVVAICVERSLEMVIGLLGILKAGGA